MSGTAITAAVRAAVRQRAAGRCEYCQSSERVSGHYFEVDHLIPLAKGGTADLQNLALACRACNVHKADRTICRDRATGEEAALFNPRAGVWLEHFVWDEDETRIVPLTMVGRVTVEVLDMNAALFVGARAIWRNAGPHPPERQPGRVGDSSAG